MGAVHVRPLVWQDLDALMEYLIVVRKNRPAARRLLDEFDRVSQVYANQPEMGDVRDDLEPPGLRSFLFRKRYVAIYRPLANGIDVLRVFDATGDYVRRFPG